MSGGEGDLELRRIQEWMLSVITNPAGARAGADSQAARTHIDLPANEIERVVSRSQQLSGIERLQVYANAYYARLVECLRDEFPAVAQVVGEEAFGGFVVQYLQAYPSMSYTLAELGAHFPQFLLESRPAPEDAAGEATWIDFLIDLATLERTYAEVFDAPGPERRTSTLQASLAALAPEDWPTAKLEPVPCLRLLELRFPVHEFSAAVRRGEGPSPPQAAPSHLAVTRRDYVVRPHALEPGEFNLLETLVVRGATVGEALEQAADSGADLEELAGNVGAWFEKWAEAEFIRDVACK